MESEVFAVPDARDSTSLAFSNTSSASEVPRGVVRGSPRPLTMVASPGATSLSFDGPHCSQHGVPRNTQEDYFAHEGGSTVLTADPGEPLESEGTVCGILYKWVNFGKGWRPRWFALKRGILSYHKVNWPNTIPLDIVEHRKPHRIIGDESQRLMKKQRNIHRSIKALGELHLQVSSVRKSNSDDKKFYIFTGTKTLHLRAESREDRSAWLDALFAAKESLPRRCPKQVIVPPLKAVLSTEKLRHRLLEEGLKEGVIDECEETMQGEILKLQKHVRALEQSHYNLIERLKHLEAEKLELETTVMDETQSKLWKDATFGRQGQGDSEPETDDEGEGPSEVEAESDEDDNVFFDTNEFLVPESLSHLDGLLEHDEATTLKECISQKGSCPSINMKGMDVDYPLIQRREKLPEPKEKEKSTSLWSIIKDNIGKDLTKVCLPVYFNEPISSLQKCFEDLEYSYLLDRAGAWGEQDNSLMQILNVAAFAVSGYSSTEGRTCKPFNPLLGETYEADYPDKGLRFFSEKVSHHPMTVACHCEGNGWVFWGDSTLKSRFWGRSIQLDPVGLLTLKFSDGKTFQWSKVSTSIYNLILGKLYCDHYGTMHIQGNTELSCKIKFKEQSFIERNSHQVQGFVTDKSGQKLATIFGTWDKALYFVFGDIMEKPKKYDPMSEAMLLWTCYAPPEFQTRYKLTAFAVTLNEILPGVKEMLPPTDSRLRPDQQHLERGEYDSANREKLKLEEKQRQARKLQETGWKPLWFCKRDDSGTFEYTGGYWEAREKKNWEVCPDIFGVHVSEG